MINCKFLVAASYNKNNDNINNNNNNDDNDNDNNNDNDNDNNIKNVDCPSQMNKLKIMV